MTPQDKLIVKREIDRRAREAQAAHDEIEALFTDHLRPSDPAKDQLDAIDLTEEAA